MKTLVIYFSQTGKTKEATERIAQLSGADLVEIKTHKSYQMSYPMRCKTPCFSYGDIRRVHRIYASN